jgi:uncharacterized repeat protein (TIGR03803 family)
MKSAFPIRRNLVPFVGCAATVAMLFVLMIGLGLLGSVAQGQTLTALYSFTGQGGGPTAGLVADNEGNFYGTTEYGGNPACALGCGSVFKMNSSGNVKLLYRFTGKADGGTPYTGLIRDVAGNLYGTTRYGGNFVCGGGCGTVFKIDAAGHETVLHSFTGADGWVPQGRLVRDATGNLYGTTYDGGDVTCNPPYGCGAVFKLDAENNETVLYAFSGTTDGRFPSSGLIRDAAGNLYGATLSGGSGDVGTVFKVDANGKETVLHSFAGEADGSSPFTDLVRLGADLYGTTATGGTFGYGTVFKVDATTGNETVVYNFTGRSDGRYPLAGLVSDAQGNLYGTTSQGGSSFVFGTVFRLDQNGNETVLDTFTGGLDGKYPQGNLVRDAAGNLYGTAELGGSLGFGTVFKVAP